MVASLRALSSVKGAVQYFYYTEKELEAGSSWHESKAVAALGFKSIKKEDFENVLSGRLAKEVELGQRTKDGIKHHPGHDLTFSAPKSVSIMALVAGDKRVLEAHERAVRRALDYLQRHLIYTRVQEGGNSRLKRSDNALIARFTHITSRPADDKTNSDPQLHTHCLIGNATLCKDGVWRSVVFDSLYNNKMLLGEIYRMELIRELMSIGYDVDITRTSKGRFLFEIKGVPQADIEAFSRRRKEILREAEKRGVSDAVDLADVALATRKSKAKTAASREELQKEWETRVQSISSLKDLSKTVEPKAKKPISKEAIKDLALQYAIQHLSNREAVFKEEDLYFHMMQRLVEYFKTHSIEMQDIEATIEAGIERGKLMCRSNERGEIILTTPENIKAEKQTIKLMQSMQGKVKPITYKHEVRKYLKGMNLNLGQRDAITLALTTKDRIVGIQGSAGTGKTTTMSVIKDIAESNGISVIGLAPTKAAASILTQHIPSHTLSYFLSKYDGVIHKRGSKEALHRLMEKFSKTLIVLDEASLVSTSQMKNFLKLAEILKFSCVIMGDNRQLGAVQNGKPFYYLQDNGMNTCVMEEIIRQTNAELLQCVHLAERAVDKDKREAKEIIGQVMENLGANVIDASKVTTSEGLQKYVKDKPEEVNVVQAAYDAWISLKDKNTLVIAPSHKLREEINGLIRTHFVTGEETRVVRLVNKNLTPAQMTYAKRYVKGDILRFGKDIPTLGIEQGSYFQVADINIKGNVLKLRQGSKIVEYDLSHKSAKKHLETYEAKNMDIAPGDKIRWTRNSQKHAFIVNGNSAVIKNITGNTIEFETKDGVHQLELSDSDMQHIDFNYTCTAFVAQGGSENHILIVIDSRLNKALMTQRAFYVMISRAKHGVTIVTNSVDKATEKLAESTGAKTSSLEHQQKIQDQPGFINLNRARREYFKYEPDAVKFKAVAEHQFVKNSKLIKDVAVALFGNPVESTSTLLVFKTKFTFKEDFHSDYYYGDNLVTVNLAGEYTRLNNINEESYGLHFGHFEVKGSQWMKAAVKEIRVKCEPKGAYCVAVSVF